MYRTGVDEGLYPAQPPNLTGLHHDERVYRHSCGLEF